MLKYLFPQAPIEVERVDSLPVVLATLMKMRIQAITDERYTPHGNHQGLSVGWLALIFLAYILTEHSHKMCPVQEWMEEHRLTLERLTGQRIRATDFTDDRLGDVLRYLSDDALWQGIEQDLSQHIIRVYDLDVAGPIRLDATTGGVTHDEQRHILFKTGRNKAGGFEVQFKLMLGSLDPLGMPLATDVVAGNTADDPLYVPIYQRIRASLGQSGLLYVGDSKMGALETRAAIAAGQDLYLMPLAMTGDIPALLNEQLDKVLAEEIQLTPIYPAEESDAAPNQELDPQSAIAEGFEIECERQATLETGAVITWQERLLIVRSKALARVRSRILESRLGQAEAELLKLTPQPGRGRRQFDEQSALQQAIDKIVKRYGVGDLLTVEVESLVTTRHIRAYRDRPARTQEIVRFQVHVTRREAAIELAKQRLGWRVYATNAPVKRLTLSAAVLAYRGQYLVERNFSRVKGPLLALLPLYVQRDDHALGLIRLLTVALRGLNIIEFVVRRSLADTQSNLCGLYAGNPKRSTARPSTELLLAAFDDIDLSISFDCNGDIINKQLTPLNSVQLQILELLDLSPELYTCLTAIPVNWPLPHTQVHLAKDPMD